MATIGQAHVDSSEKGGRRRWVFIDGTVFGNALGAVLWVLLLGFSFLVALSADFLYERGASMWPFELGNILLVVYPVLWLICLFASIVLLFRKRPKAGLIASLVPVMLGLVMAAVYFVWIMWDSL